MFTQLEASLVKGGMNEQIIARDITAEADLEEPRLRQREEICSLYFYVFS